MSDVWLLTSLRFIRFWVRVQVLGSSCWATAACWGAAGVKKGVCCDNYPPLKVATILVGFSWLVLCVRISSPVQVSCFIIPGQGAYKGATYFYSLFIHFGKVPVELPD